jgi:O-antigen ligase
MKKAKLFNPEILVKASLSIMLIALPFDNAIFHLGTLILWVGAFLVSRQPTGPNFGATIATQKNVHWTFLSIVAIMVVSNLANGQDSEAWRTLATFIVRYWLFFALLSYLYMRRIVDMEFLLAVATVGLLVQFVPFIGQMINGQIFVGQEFAGRFQGFTSNPNVLGLYAGLGMMVSLHLIVSQESGKKLVLLTAVALGLMATIALLASGNRGGWVAVIVALIFYAASQIRQQPKILITSFATVGFLSVGVLTQMARPRARLADLIDGHSASRIDVWLNSWTLFKQQPILGYGLDTRQVLLENHFVYSEHNIVLNVMLAMGLVGLLAYGSLMFFICWPALKNRNIIGLSLMGFLMAVGMFGFDFYRSQHFMICFAVLAVVCLQHGRLSGALNSEEK